MTGRGRAASRALLAASLLALAACGGETAGVRAPNRAPTVRITSAPIEDSLNSYRVTFRWTAEDADGWVERFVHALDDTAAADSLRSGVEAEASFLLAADAFIDTVHVEGPFGAPEELYRFGRHHTFHVRAIDNEGLASPFASVAFFAVTVAPVTEIVVPEAVEGEVVLIGTRVDLAWRGTDLDGPPPERFAVRMVQVDRDSAFGAPASLLDCADCAPPWSEFLPQTTASYSGLAEAGYLFGVRAMDEAGAVEPELAPGTNVIRLMVHAHPGYPMIRVSGPGKVIRYPAGDEDRTIDVGSGQTVRLGWEIDASEYGARVAGVYYGVDLESTDPADPGWIPAAGSTATVQFVNPAGIEESVHIFYLLVLDSAGQEIVVDVILRVGPPNLRLDVLYVDDLADGATNSPSEPSDEVRDAMILDVFLAEARRRGLRVDQYEVQDRYGRIDEEAPELGVLRRYKLLVWSVGSNLSAFNQAMDPDGPKVVEEYLLLGGQLLIMGRESLSRSIHGLHTEYFGFRPWDFGYRFFHIESEFSGQDPTAGGFFRPRGNPGYLRVDGLDAALATPAARAEGWPDLLVTRPPYASPISGLPVIEGMVRGYEHGERPGRLDTLYTFVSNGSTLWPPIPSMLDDAPCAFRSEASDHGRVMVFSFPVFWFSDGAIDSLGTQALRWFFDERPRSYRYP